MFILPEYPVYLFCLTLKKYTVNNYFLWHLHDSSCWRTQFTLHWSQIIIIFLNKQTFPIMFTRVINQFLQLLIQQIQWTMDLQVDVTTIFFLPFKQSLTFKKNKGFQKELICLIDCNKKTFFNEHFLIKPNMLRLLR